VALSGTGMRLPVRVFDIEQYSARSLEILTALSLNRDARRSGIPFVMGTKVRRSPCPNPTGTWEFGQVPFGQFRQ
jgi:hypothetical protein